MMQLSHLSLVSWHLVQGELQLVGVLQLLLISNLSITQESHIVLVLWHVLQGLVQEAKLLQLLPAKSLPTMQLMQ